jgi:thiamine transport system substrate-binding protein
MPFPARQRHDAVRTVAAIATVTVLPAVLAGCSLGGGEEDTTPASQRVVVATHGSWNMDKAVLRAFTEETGYQVQVKPSGDAGELTNKLVLTKGSPIADLVYGIDNTFVSRAAEEGVLAPHEPADPIGEELEPQDAGTADLVTPIDFSDVCVNVDDTWFAEQDLEPPSTYDDLADPRYEDLFVTPAPPTSSPGLAFLVGTVARYGEDGWEDYWQRLLDNGAKVTAGWEDAYTVDFTAGGGGGDRPIVQSNAS